MNGRLSGAEKISRARYASYLLEKLLQHRKCDRSRQEQPAGSRRVGAFYFSYRVPLLRNWLTIYSDSEAHDDVSPISAPRRASIRPGLDLSDVPGIAKLDVRVEAVSTDPPSSRSNGGQFNYYEDIQRRVLTTWRFSAIGLVREAKGGQGWITYHLSGNEWVQVDVQIKRRPEAHSRGDNAERYQLSSSQAIGKES